MTQHDSTKLRDKVLYEHTKRELADKLIEAVQGITDWSEVALSIAAYHYLMEPHAAIYKDGTFAPATLAMIKERALLVRMEFPYSRIILVLDDLGKLKPEVGVEVLSSEEFNQKYGGKR